MGEELKGISKEINQFITKKLYWLKDCPDESSVRAQLAKMRRGLGKEPGDSPELWGLLFADLPEDLMGKGTKPSKAERAIYMSLTLYAAHQQGKSLKERNMNEKDIGFGQAVAKLALDRDKSLDTVRKRFHMTALSSDIVELAWHMKGMIQLFKQKEIALDYAKLAEDFYYFQFLDRMTEIRLKWGRDFYRCINENTKEEV